MNVPPFAKSEYVPIPPSVNAAMARAMTRSAYERGLPAEALRAIVSIADPNKRQFVLVAFLTALTVHMPAPVDAAELLEVFAALERLPPLRALRVPPDKFGDFLIVRGSGKKTIRTLNISTPSSLLASSAGARIVKMGSTGTSSMPGSADFASEIGINIHATSDRCLTLLRETGWGHFNTENIFKKTCELYKGFFYFPHILMFGWPRMTPFVGGSMLYGISHSDIDFCVEVLRNLRAVPATVVSTKVNEVDYIDEALPLGKIRLRQIASDGSVRKLEFDGEELVGERVSLGDIAQPSDYESSISTALRTLSGKGSQGHTLLYALNAGLMLWVQNLAPSLRDGFDLARDVLFEGLTIDKIKHVVSLEGGSPERIDHIVSTGRLY